MLDRSPGEWARICRVQAAITTNEETRQYLIAMAMDYEAQAAVSYRTLKSLFFDQPSGAFRDGYVFRPTSDRVSGMERNDKLGFWSCDSANENRLTWSDRVYDLFGIPRGAVVDREWAASRYESRSRLSLDRVRAFALRTGCGYILDAQIRPQRSQPIWMRVYAVPLLNEKGDVVGLEGVKRQL